MNNNQSPLMAIALAGILSPAANAATILETTDFSNSAASPTVLGAFNPAIDAIIGSVKAPDSVDFIRLSGPANAPISLKLSLYDPDPSPALNFYIYDNPNNNGLLEYRFYSDPTANDTIVFTVPADGDFVVELLNSEGGGYAYTIGTVPEPGTGALLGAGLAAAALRRKRKGGSPEA